MNNNIIIHALIPARGGSKSIPKKNIKIYKKYPLLVHSINVANTIPFISKIVVSTDCNEIKNIALKNGACVPFLRPLNISDDYSTDLECFQHYISWLKFNKQQIPDIIVHLRPTYPERNNNILYKCLTQFIEVRDIYTSLRTVVSIDKSLFKMYTIDKESTSESNLKLVLKPTYQVFNNIREPYNQVRQILPTTYLHNGCVDIINTQTIENGSMSGDTIYPFVMNDNETYDIDTYSDWKKSLSCNINDDCEDEIKDEIEDIEDNIDDGDDRDNTDDTDGRNDTDDTYGTNNTDNTDDIDGTNNTDNTDDRYDDVVIKKVIEEDIEEDIEGEDIENIEGEIKSLLNNFNKFYIKSKPIYIPVSQIKNRKKINFFNTY